MAVCASLTLAASQETLDARASTSSVNIIEPTDNEDDYAFELKAISVAAGDTVTWLNSGLEIHSVVADGKAFDSKDIAPGSSWSYTFAAPGTYTYYCEPHPWMTGTVVVQ